MSTRSMLMVSIMAVVLTTGCAESAVLAGNGVSMLVACALLWSTVNLGRND